MRTPLYSGHFNLSQMSYFFLFGCLGNTKVITQSALQAFQEEMGKVLRDPYKVYCI